MKQHIPNADQLGFPSPDQEFIDLSSRLLKPGSRILDVGAGRGTHALYLANSGHDVTAVECESSYLDEARTLAATLGNRAIKLAFEEGDVRDMNFDQESFDAILMTRVLQEFSDKEASRNVVERIQGLTRAGGYNFVIAYVGTMNDQIMLPHLSIFYPGELNDFYLDRGWDLVHTDQHLSPVQNSSDGPRITGRDEFVAHKPVPQRQGQPHAQLSLEYLRAVDPEYYEAMKLF